MSLVESRALSYSDSGFDLRIIQLGFVYGRLAGVTCLRVLPMGDRYPVGGSLSYSDSGYNLRLRFSTNRSSAPSCIVLFH